MIELKARSFQRRDGERGHIVAVDDTERVFVELGKDFQVSPDFYTESSESEIRGRYRLILEIPSIQFPKPKGFERQTREIAELAQAISKLVVQEAHKDGRFSTLNAKEQQVLESRYLSEEPKSYKEIADDLGINKTTVWRIRNRAFRKLAKLRLEQPKPLQTYESESPEFNYSGLPKKSNDLIESLKVDVRGDRQVRLQILITEQNPPDFKKEPQGNIKNILEIAGGSKFKLKNNF